MDLRAAASIVGRSVTVQPRIPKLLGRFAFPAAYMIDQINCICKVTTNLSLSIGFNLIRTWSSAWCTDSRFGLTKSSCRLGCAEQRRPLSRFLQCTVLHEAILVAIPAISNALRPYESSTLTGVASWNFMNFTPKS